MPRTNESNQNTAQSGGNALNLFNRNRKSRSDVAQAHRDSLLKILDHRLEVARSRGDANLIKQLEAERQQMV
jgi:hypothetical protein